MIVELVLLASVLLQLAAAILALRLTRITGSRSSFVLIATAILLMALRRAITLFRLVSGDMSQPPDLAAELVALTISALMFMGMTYIVPLFRSIKLAEEKTKEYSDKLEETVEEIEKSALKYRNLTEESMQGIAIYQDGRYVYANPAFARTVGYTVDEMLGFSSKRVWELIHIDDREKMKKCFGALDAGLQFLPMTRFRYVGKDGASRWVESFSRRIEYEGRPGLQLLNIDVTEQKRAEEGLRAAAETATFHLDLMGHDIRNHLQAIVMAADILKQSDLSPVDQQVFDLIIESVQNSRTLIGKISSTRDLLSVPLSDIRLKHALDESLRRVSESHDDVKIEVEYRVKKGVVKADQYLGNLLTNLLENAVLHNNSKTRHIWVVLSEANGGFEISIADNGPGIPDSKKETLFDPERRFGGVGIHQALKITQKYGGRMNIHDRVHGDSSQGTEFRIWLPMFVGSS